MSPVQFHANRLLPAVASSLLAVMPLNAQESSLDTSIDDFFRDFSAEWVRANPDQATFTRYFTGEEQIRLEQQLTPRTEAWSAARTQLARDGLEQLAAFDGAKFSDDQRVSADIMQWQLETLVAGDRFRRYGFPLQQFNGANVGLVNTLTIVHPIQTPQDAANYVLRLGQVAERIAEATAVAEQRSEAGVRPPLFILEASIEQMERFLSATPGENELVTAFATKMGQVTELSAGQREDLRNQATGIVETDIYPAWRRSVAALEAQLPLANNDAGLWRFAEGAEVYAYQLKRFTTTDLTAEEIHEIGLSEVERIEGEMDALLAQVGISEGSINERAAELRTRMGYPLTEEGRERIMEDIEGFLRDAEARAELLFDERPVAPVIAQAYPRNREEFAAASYTPPAPDGSRPGIYQMPLRANRMTEFQLRTLVYHETVPGHHFQIALAAENTNLPRFRQLRTLGGISAVSEGWALYAERLAAESGWYEGDVEGLIGQLDSSLFRARRLVVDTGLHAKGWTRQQAIDYGITPSEVDRYVVMPGQACSYMIGQLKLVELRERAREALGERFSLRQFHNEVLDTGVVPLAVLEEQVEAYISAAQP